MNNIAQTTVDFQPIAEQLEFAHSTFPSLVINSEALSNTEDTTAWVQTHKTALEHQLAKSGAILFRGFPIDSAESFDAFAAAFGYDSFTYQESLSNAIRINYTERVFTANEAPKDVEIFLHHEMAQTPLSPNKVFFFCSSAAEQGGATPICRSDQLFAALRNENPELALQFTEKGVKYTTQMPPIDNPESGQGRSWKSTLSVNSKVEAESKLAELGYSWEWLDDGSLRAITPVLPAVLKLSDDIEVFYNQLIAAFMGWRGVRKNPASAITFGDGSHIPIAGLERIVELSNDFTFDIPWQDGDVALIDNQLTMHGRRPFQGDRKRVVLVALAV